MASKASDYNIDNKSMIKYKFKKLRNVENTIEFSGNNEGSDSCNRGDDNLSGYKNFKASATLIPLPTSLKLILHRYVKDFLKHQRKIFLPLRKQI